jgi:membrane-bound lytic murein transglycosylase B
LLALACAAPAQGKTKAPVKHGAQAAAKQPLVVQAAAQEEEVIYGSREDVQAFADKVAAEKELDAAWVRKTLSEARFVPSVAKAIMPPPAGSAKNWAAYRARFVEPRRLRAAQKFWDANAAALDRAEQQFGVPASIIVGIIGVETLYGQHTGRYRVLDALATLSFDFPEGRKDRSPFFRDELAAFLLMCQRMNLDPLSVKGSYAGAMGLPQFMPSSVLSDGIDFDEDGRIDLLGSATDAIGSVANFLQRRGWQTGLATHYSVAAPVDVQARAVLLGPDIKPTFSVEEFETQGARFEAQERPALLAAGKLALVELQNGEAAPSFVAGTQNFYALTRYNWSSYYAMAVIDLGQTAQALRLTQAPAAPTAAVAGAEIPRRP